MSSRKDRKCVKCPTMIGRDSSTGLCQKCLVESRKPVQRRCAKCPENISQKNQTGLCTKCLRESKRLPDRICLHCPAVIARDSKSGLCAECMQKQRHSTTVSEDRERRRVQNEISYLKQRYDEAVDTIERQAKELSAVTEISDGLQTFLIEPSTKSGTSEATAVMCASDWHVEENVGGEVSGLNTFNLEIARYRATRFFQKGLRLTNLLAQDIKIPTIVLPLLGDFITNDIHDTDQNEVTPIFALIEAQNMIISGIEFLLSESNYNLVIPCHSGNHARTTQKTQFASENGHSLEYLMYLHLASYFRDDPRVKFVIPEGMHSYVQIYDQTIRFHHGHAVKYGGGVGGIYIPVNKAIAQWNKGRHADLDVFGHFHQMRDGGNFICNGSLIGYNAFALSIKADYEVPKQALFLIDKKRGRTCTWPILVG